MDLKSIIQTVAKDDEPLALVIRDRDHKPYLAADGAKATISVLGSESKDYKRKRNALYKKLVSDGASDEEIRIAVAACAVTAWKGWEDDGKPLPCTEENVKAFLSVDHIILQVEAGIERKTSFFADES